MGGFGALLVGIGVLTGSASAGPFTAKSSQGAWVADAVARPLVLPKGWLEVGLSADTKRSTQYRGGDGELRARTQTISPWRYSRLWFRLRQGFSDRVTLSTDACPLWTRGSTLRWAVRSARPMSVMHASASSYSRGLNAVWMRDSRWNSRRRRVWSGRKGQIGPGDTHGFLTGTRTTDLAAHLHGRLTVLDRLKLGADLGYVHKICSDCWLCRGGWGFGNGVMDPGNEVHLRGSVMGKVVRGVSVSLAGRYGPWVKLKSASTAMVSASFDPSRPPVATGSMRSSP